MLPNTVNKYKNIYLLIIPVISIYSIQTITGLEIMLALYICVYRI